ncbi:uncharacterized protein [Musca autumnalis]|uniref:uncharacterized protein n=1 Tax=Musca autumnalis TaxID=221902 RepID=UPI003CE76900
MTLSLREDPAAPSNESTCLAGCGESRLSPSSCRDEDLAAGCDQRILNIIWAASIETESKLSTGITLSIVQLKKTMYFNIMHLESTFLDKIASFLINSNRTGRVTSVSFNL